MRDKIRSVIVEDEQVARDLLKLCIEKYCPQIEIVGEANDCNTAIEILKKLQPQLVFLDVEMPFGNAFNVLEGCNELYFETIFVTAFSEYSLQALNQSATYYLLKPISVEELIQAVNKVERHIINKEVFDRNKILLENIKESKIENRQVILPTLEGFEVVKMENIIRLQGNGNFTNIYLRDKEKKMVCRFLKYFQELLSFPFVRVHKSHIVNLNYIKAYHKSSGGYLVLEDDTEIEISQSYKDDFLKIFKMN